MLSPIDGCHGLKVKCTRGQHHEIKLMWRRTSAETMVYRAKDVYVAPLALTAQHQIIEGIEQVV